MVQQEECGKRRKSGGLRSCIRCGTWERCGRTGLLTRSRGFFGFFKFFYFLVSFVLSVCHSVGAGGGGKGRVRCGGGGKGVLLWLLFLSLVVVSVGRPPPRPLLC